MLDNNSLEVISRFKSRILSDKLNQNEVTLGRSNRGNKAHLNSEDEESIKTQVVDYNGSARLVLTNKSIEKFSKTNKRKWDLEFGISESNFDGGSDSDVKSEDEDEDEGEDEDEDEHRNPMKKIKLVDILSPLIHPSELVSHPAIKKTYESQVYSKLASEIIDTIEIEQNNLNWLEKLLNVLSEEDWVNLLDDKIGLPKYDHGLNEDGAETAASNTNGHVVAEVSTTVKKESAENDKEENSNKRITRTLSHANGDGDGATVPDPFFALPEALKKYEKHERIATEESGDELQNIKEDLINYLQVSLQRQQEYIKNLTEIRLGIVRADRLKQELFKWGKEMYDKKSG